MGQNHALRERAERHSLIAVLERNYSDSSGSVTSFTA